MLVVLTAVFQLRAAPPPKFSNPKDIMNEIEKVYSTETAIEHSRAATATPAPTWRSDAKPGEVAWPTNHAALIKSYSTLARIKMREGKPREAAYYKDLAQKLQRQLVPTPPPTEHTTKPVASDQKKRKEEGQSFVEEPAELNGDIGTWQSHMRLN